MIDKRVFTKEEVLERLEGFHNDIVSARRSLTALMREVEKLDSEFGNYRRLALRGKTDQTAFPVDSDSMLSVAVAQLDALDGMLSATQRQMDAECTFVARAYGVQRYSYPALLRETAEGRYAVRLPDFPEFCGEEDSPAKANTTVRSFLAKRISDALAQNEALPRPSMYASIKAAEDEKILRVSVEV